MASTHRQLYLTTAGLSFLLFAAACATVAISSTASRQAASLLRGGAYWAEPKVPGIIWLRPRHLTRRGENAVLVAGIISIVAAAIAFMTSFFWNKFGILAVMATMIVAFGAFLTSVVALPFAIVQRSNSDSFIYTDQYSTGRRYTLEGWVCSIELPQPAYAPRFNRVCINLRVARFMTIALIILSFSIIVLAILGLMKKRGGATVVDSKNEQNEQVELKSHR